MPSVKLPGTLIPRVRFAEDLGPLPSDTVIRGITLVFSRSPEQQSALDQLLAAQTNPSSPLFHHWLTPAEFTARFGPATEDMAVSQSWLRSRGFTVEAAAPNADRITFSGTASQVREAFGADLHRFRSNDELHFAPVSDISLPPALAPVTAAVLHLSDFRPKPNIRPQPNYTTLSSQTHFLTPNDVLTMYNLWPLEGRNYGASQSIAVVGESYVSTAPDSAISRFSLANSRGISFTPILVPGSGVEAIFHGDEGESEIDIEYSSAISGANIFFVFTGSNSNYNVNDAIAFAITHNIAPVISISYSECEPVLSSAEVQQYNSLFQQAAAQGQTIVAASGDRGSTACADYSTASGLSTAQIHGLAVNFPASSPFVTAVGGTQMAPGTFTAGSSPYWNTATLNDLVGSLVGYTPEVVWNEDSPTEGIFASAGGTSTIFARPSWQSGVPGIPAGSFRLVPDVSFQASIANPGYLICTDDPTIGGDSSDCANLSNLSNSRGVYVLNGGTSFAAPIFAGFIAFLNGYEQSTAQGNVNPILYSLAAQPSIYSSAFHDITVGTTACVSGDGNCASPGQSAFAATTGYDQATGLGSFDFAKLAAAWPVSSSKGLILTDIYTSLPNNANPGDTLTLPIQIGESSIIGAPGPTGQVSINVDGAAPVSVPITVSGTQSTATYSFKAPSVTGSHTVNLIYPGDATHSGSTTTVAVMIGSPLATGSISLSANSLTLPANGTGATQVTITPSGGYNGALTWTSSYTGGTTPQTICYLVNSPPVISGATTTTMHMGVGTACNSPLPTGNAQPSRIEHAAFVPRLAAPGLSRGLTTSDRSQLAENNPCNLLQQIATSATIPALAALALGWIPRRRGKRLPYLAAFVILTVPALLIGCGGATSGSGGGGGGTNQQPQNYTVTITAKDSVNTSISASTTFTLTVQ